MNLSTLIIILNDFIPQSQGMIEHVYEDMKL
jgi:hypothetical protein